MAHTLPCKLLRLWNTARCTHSLPPSCCASVANVFSVKHSCTSPAPYFITTPIFYVNAQPHIGHLYTALLADTIARWQRLQERQVLFSTGTDEHGLKVQQAAALNKQNPLAFCDEVSEKFSNLFSSCNVSHTDYIRTSQARHKDAVNSFWKTLSDAGHIYRGTYQGWYSMADEAFVTDDQVSDVTDEKGSRKVATETGSAVEWVKEDNYMFRLSSFSSELSAWLDTGVIQPAKFESIVRQMLVDLPDLSVSRESTRLSWGIPVPGDDTQTIYVWLDALVNYLTVGGYPNQGYHWPADCHVIGKDILRFHAIYWPAFLLAAGLPLPKSILCHSHWLMDNFKMSKSRGNVIDPVERTHRYTADGLRYFLLREGAPHMDGNYTDKRVVEVINVELVNTLGNLLSRCTGKKVNKGNSWPALGDAVWQDKACESHKTMLADLAVLPGRVKEQLDSFYTHRALQLIMDQLRATNAFLEMTTPWKLAKSAQDQDREWLECILSVTMETLRVSGILLQPVIPNLASKLLDRLNVPPTDRLYKHATAQFNETSCTRQLGADKGMFLPRIKEE